MLCFTKVYVKELEPLPSGKRRTQLTMEGFQFSEWVRTLAKPCPIYGNSEEGKAQNVDNYTKLEGTMSVIHTEGIDGGRATWTVQFEKVSDDMNDPENIISTTIWYFKRMDQKIFSNL